MAKPPPRIISGEVPSISVYFIFLCSNRQARILFETFFGVEGVESSPRSCAKEFRHLGWAPLFTTTRYHRWVPTAVLRGSCKCSCRHTTPLQVCGSSGSTGMTRAYITPPNAPCGCSDVLSLRFLSSPLIYYTPKHTLWVFGRPITPPGLAHPPWPPCELHFITRGTQDITHPTGYHTR